MIDLKNIMRHARRRDSRLSGAWLLGFLLLLPVGSRAAVHNVRDYGAKGDGKAIDSPAINAAIGAAVKAGGGTVYFPAGTYASYSIRLESHITLYLEKGAVLLAAKPSATEGYDAPEPCPYDDYQDFGHSHWKNSLIWGIGLEDITIGGDGMIDGEGLLDGNFNVPEVFRLRNKLGDLALPAGQGNKAISLKNCRGVTIRDLTLYRCGHFALLATGVDNLNIHDLVIDSNRDGLDIDACRNVRVTGCLVNTPWDDGIVLKASYALGYYRDTENVVISDCALSGYETGALLDGTRALPVLSGSRNKPGRLDRRAAGRIKFGTESSGGFKNVAITNCTFDLSGGVLLESMDGGDLEDVVIGNLTMRRVVGAPLFIRLGARMRSPEGRETGHIRRVRIHDVNAVYDTPPLFGIIIAGIPGHPVEDISIRCLHVHATGGLTPEAALKEVPEGEKKYPDPWRFGGPMPAKGMYLRHVDGLVLDDVRFTFDAPDSRPLILQEDVKNLTLNPTHLE